MTYFVGRLPDTLIGGITDATSFTSRHIMAHFKGNCKFSATAQAAGVQSEVGHNVDDVLAGSAGVSPALLLGLALNRIETRSIRYGERPKPIVHCQS
jgi:hypothetical protein